MRMASSIRFLAFTSLLCWTASPVIAQDGLGAMLDRPSAGGAVLAITYCPDEGESSVECVSHDLSCKNSFDLTLFVAGDTDSTQRVTGIVQDLLKGGYGNAKIKFKVGGKEPDIDMRVYSIDLSEQDLDGTWDLSFSFDDRAALFGAITDSTKSLAAVVGDKTLEFAPRPEDVPKLLQFKEACLAKGG